MISPASTFEPEAEAARALDPGQSMYGLAEELFPFCRSITGEGLRQTLRVIRREIGITLHEVPSGTPVFDWTVPREWNVRQAYIETLDGRRVVDFAACNLHLLQYSVPVDRVVPVEELQKHLHSLPETPDWVPYRTAYYANTWGFCVSQRQRDQLTEPAYRVVIDSSLADGSMSYGELFLEGERDEEVLISTHVCHPSMANDNLSGIAVAVQLARRMAALPRRFGYRFLFLPGTIGAITWLASHKQRAAAIRYGLIFTCLGDAGSITYKQSRRGSAEIDRIVEHVLGQSGDAYRIAPFIPYGYDERQYCSPGFNLPVGAFMRSPNGTFPEYHTSADNLELIRPEHLADSYLKLCQILDVVEQNETYISTSPYCEPQLGKRGLYRPIGGQKEAGDYDQMTLLWVLNLADGEHSLLDIATRAGMPFASVRMAAVDLLNAGLLRRAGEL